MGKMMSELKMRVSLADLIEKLFIVNHKIWELEADIREGREEELGLEEVGKRAISIRNLNKERITIKNEINRRFDPENYYQEIKVNHRSEDESEPSRD
jgi:hypothetical protein